LHTVVSGGFPAHSGTIGLQNPTFSALVSQLLPAGQVPLVAHSPALHTSCPRWLFPAQA
jgi:hypothetical protein